MAETGRRRRRRTFSLNSSSQLLLLLPLLSLFVGSAEFVSAGILDVRSKFAGRDRSISDLRAHDSRRQVSLLPGVDLPLAGSGRADGVGLYYAQIGIGTPSKNYYVQVDTGSDIMWVNCIQCTECPTKSSLGIQLTLYDIKESLTGHLVPCNTNFCSMVNNGPIYGCTSNMTCTYIELYGDDSSTVGYFVKDIVQYDRVSGDLNTTAANGSLIFGCGARQSGDLTSSDEALDGILGFGNSNSSAISQLAASGVVKNMFAHCLDGVNGGGIFAIGHVVQPQVNTTSIVSNQKHYSVYMKSVEVGNKTLNISTDVLGLGKNRQGAIIDSGTTLAYLPREIFEPLLIEIFAQHSDMKIYTIEDQYTCFRYSGSVDDAFPNVTFHFNNSLYLNVQPHEYLFSMDHMWCLGWQNSGNQSRDRQDMILLGDLVLSNKLVFYDLEKQVMGWTEYNCSSSIQVQDEQTGTVHLIGPRAIVSHASPKSPGVALLSLAFLVMLLHIVTATLL
uniref:Peptidase A1 domain-containing protein n=1 Tax=Kalanchoe fedtschenkoi TaxID=63787 RepID=A0A7N0TSB4_KALFE